MTYLEDNMVYGYFSFVEFLGPCLRCADQVTYILYQAGVWCRIGYYEACLLSNTMVSYPFLCR